MRWSNDPRRTSAAEERWETSFSRLRVACYRVIIIDDTIRKPMSQYIFRTNVLESSLSGLGGLQARSDKRSISQPAADRAYENKGLTCRILSGKVASVLNWRSVD